MIAAAALVVMLVAGRIWRRRVPPQNLLQAAGLIAVLAVALAAWFDGPGLRFWRYPGTLVLVAWAALPTARLLATWCCRGFRSAAYYGLGLNLLAGILTALPLGWFLRSQGVALSGGSYAPFYFWLTLVGWSVGALLITLPCWLDKLRDGPGRVVPVAGAFK